MKKQKSEIAVYIGPTIRGYCEHGRIYPSRDAAEKGLDRLLEKYPSAADFIVSACELAEARIQIKTPGNALYEKQKRFLRLMGKKEV